MPPQPAAKTYRDCFFLIAHIYLANSLTQFVFLLNKIKSFAKKLFYRPKYSTINKQKDSFAVFLRVFFCVGKSLAISMDSTQNKLLLLFVFDKMEMPLSEQTILEMCCSANNWINYIDCKQALMQLIDANFVAAVNKGRVKRSYVLYYAEGRICLAHFFVRIPSSLREVVSDNVKLNRMNYKRKQEYASDYQKIPTALTTCFLK